MKSSIEKSIEVQVPAQTAYNQWTQFEKFPDFMEGIERVEQLDDSHLKWCAEIAGVNEEWRSEITEQIPDKRIAWKADGPAPNCGVVTFHRLTDDCCKIMVQVDYEPEGLLENIGDAMGIVARRVEGDLERFRDFIENRGAATGGWRGRIPSPDDRLSDSPSR